MVFRKCLCKCSLFVYCVVKKWKRIKSLCNSKECLCVPRFEFCTSFFHNLFNLPSYLIIPSHCKYGFSYLEVITILSKSFISACYSVCAVLIESLKGNTKFWEILKNGWIVILYNFNIFGCPCGCIKKHQKF